MLTAAKGNGDDNWYIASLFTVDAASGAMKPLLERPGIQIAGPRWSPDGNHIVFIGRLMSDEPVPGGDIYAVSANGGTMRNLTPNMKMTANSLHWAQDSRGAVFAGISNGQSVIARVQPDGIVSQIWMGPQYISAGPLVPQISLASDGNTAAAVVQSFAQGPEVWAGPIGSWKQITHRNSSFKPAWGEAKSLTWRSDSFEVQGWLIYPKDLTRPGSIPWSLRFTADLLARCCRLGRPGGIWPWRCPRRGTSYCSRTRAAAMARARNSRANVKDFGYGDFRDVMASVDAAVRSAPIDQNRVGITGWSYGGYMTMWGDHAD